MKRIRLLNWMAFAGEQSLGPLPPGPIAVVGRYVDNARRSNWSGKTACLEAIRFALTGAHRKRLDDSLITNGADEMEVEVEMSTGLRVLRRRPRGGPTVLRVVDEANMVPLLERDAAEAHLARVLRLPVDDFDNTSWFGQGDVQALVGKSSGVRREVFSRWLELDLWERMSGRANEKARTARTLLEAARRSSAGAPPRDQALIDKERGLLESERLHLEAERDQLSHYLEELAASSAVLASVAARRSDAELAARHVKTYRDDLATLPAPRDVAEVEALEEAKKAAEVELATAEADAREARSLMTGSFDGKCPVTCEACPVSSEVSTKRDAFFARGEGALERARVAKAELTKIREVLAVETACARSRAKLVASMNEALVRARATRAALAEVEGKVDLEEAKKSEELRATNRQARDRLDARMREIDASLGALREEVRYAATYAQRVEQLEAGIAIAEKDARIAQLVARALGGSGIPAKIAQVSLSGLEERANAILSGLGLSFTLTWERELADPAPACAECGHVYEKRTRAQKCPSCGAARSRKKSDELDVLVDDGSGEIEDVRAKSGGAKVLVASAIRLSGGMMLRERRGSPLEVAFIDEPFGELDLENRDALARTFSGLLSTVGLEQAFVVSHDAQLLSGLPARIVVRREGSTSRLELEA